MTAGKTAQISDPSLLASRLRWSLFLRLTVAILGLVAILIYQKTLQFFPSRLVAAYLVLVFACFINLIYLISLRWQLINFQKLVIIQIILDIILESLLVYFTGGIKGSIFIYLYFASVVAGALLTSARGSFLFASLASIALSAITITYFLADHFKAGLPFLPPDFVVSMTSEFRFIVAYLSFFALALYLVAFLAGRLTIELSQERLLKGEILQGMTSGVIVVDRKGKVVFHNPQIYKLLGLTADVSDRNKELTSLLSKPEEKILYNALLNTEPFKGEFSLQVNGKDSDIEFIVTPLKGARGETRGNIALLNDITAYTKIEDLTKEAQKWQSLSEIGTSIAHEIRNPLASIKSAAQELNILDKLTPPEKKLMQIIVKETDRLNRIITDFLNFTRERPLTIQECHIGKILDEVVFLLERKDVNRQIKIQKEIKGNLVCPGDAEQLKQVFLNLGLNGLESETDRVIFRAYPDGLKGIVVEIIDFGKGIEPELLDRIYQPFFTNKPGGGGMGLAISRKIILMHQGKITLDSTPGAGTKFTIRLPR